MTSGINPARQQSQRGDEKYPAKKYGKHKCKNAAQNLTSISAEG